MKHERNRQDRRRHRPRETGQGSAVERDDVSATLDARPRQQQHETILEAHRLRVFGRRLTA